MRTEMDHKSWIWKKKTLEKNAVGRETGRRSSFSRNEEEVEILLNGKAELERDIQKLNDKLSSVILECNAKDDFSQRQAKIAHEAIAGWEKAETEAIFLKQELENALYQIAAGDERLVHLDAALKECMHQLREKRVHDAVFEKSKEFEKTRNVLEEKLAKLGAENTQLSKALLGKEKVIENLSVQKAHTEREFNTLLTRLEKENASLKKELEIRNEEREFNRRTADASHKQHLMDDFVEMERLTVEKEKQSWTPFSKNIGASDMNLMDDFVEMERLTVEKIDKYCAVGGVQPQHDEIELSTSTQKIQLEDVSINRGILSHKSPSISKVIEIIEGILPYRVSETQAGFTVRHFQWKTSELSVILQEFIQTCQNLLDGNADFEKFAEQLTCTLEWIVNHCFSLQDVSSMKDAIKNHFDWDDSRSECEVEPGLNNHISEVNEGFAPMKEDLERKLQSKIVETESLMAQLQESESTITSLKMELENLRDLKLMIEDQAERQKITKQDLEMKLAAAKLELNEACQKYSHLEKEMERQYKEPVSAHDKLKFWESIPDKEIPQHDVDNEETTLQNDWEITAASEKLAECQETILNLGKQLKALASPRDASVFDNVIPIPKNKLGCRSSLLDRMLDEYNDGQYCESPATKELILNGNIHSAFGANSKTEPPNGNRNTVEEELVDSLAIVPSKKKNGGLLKKLFCKLQRDHLISCITD